jgi:hypothetical protein
MSEELTLITATPVVKLLKVYPYSTRERIEVRAASEDGPRGLSLYYTTESDEAPSANEKLLVAVLAGVYPSWLTPTAAESLAAAARDEPVPIRFEGVSAIPHGGSDPSRSIQHDALHIDAVAGNGMTRLHMSMANEAGSIHLARVMFSKGQVTSMIAALLAIYPRLREN